jgi:hypothetical protein
MDKITVTLEYQDGKILISSTDKKFIERHDGNNWSVEIESIYYHMERISYWAKSINTECVFKIIAEE